VHLIDQLYLQKAVDDIPKDDNDASDGEDSSEIGSAADAFLPGTLAQEALISGDRYLFRLLTDRYHANVMLPISPPAICKPRDPINLYTRLAYTDHQDVWFGYVSECSRFFHRR
jgi:hypothetical protein